MHDGSWEWKRNHAREGEKFKREDQGMGRGIESLWKKAGVVEKIREED